MKGIILAGGLGSRLYPATFAVSKHILPVYDKPMIYYPLTTLMLAGIRDYLVITAPQFLPLYQNLLQDGEQWGLNIQYATQAEPKGIADAFIIGESFINNEPVSLVLGDNVFYGTNLRYYLKKATMPKKGATIFAHYVKDPSAYGVVVLDDKQKPIDLEEKPTKPRSHYAVSGIYFYDNQVVDIAKSLAPSGRGELEITDVNKAYLAQQTLEAEVFHRGLAWLDMGTPQSLLEAANFIHTLEKRQGLKVGCPEEAAWHMGYINNDQLAKLAQSQLSSGYGDYLLSLFEA